MSDRTEAVPVSPKLERVLLVALFGWATAIIVLRWWGASFVHDDWSFLLDRRGSFDVAIAAPYNEHIVVGLSLIYRGLTAVFGLDPTAFRLLLTLVWLASAALVFVYVRRRVGPVLALLGTAITLLMGSAYQDLLWPVQVGYMISFACGLGALMLLERGEVRHDAAAAALLLVATTTFTVGLAFLAGAVVAIAVDGRRLNRLWVLAPAAAVFLAWWIGWGSSSDSAITFENVVSSPAYVFDGFAASFAGLLNIDNPQSTPMIITGLEWGRPIAAVAGVAVILRLAHLGRIPRPLLVVLAAAVAYWLILGCFETSDRQPDASRMRYGGAVFVLLITAELLADVRLRRVTVIVLGVLGAAAIVSNANQLGHASERFTRIADRERAGLTAIELMRDRVAPTFTLTRPLIDTGFAPVSAGPYLDALDDYGGSPAFTEDELAEAPQRAREVADRTLAVGLGVELTRQPAPSQDCRAVRLSGDPPTVVVPPGGLEITATRGGGYAGVRVQLARFAKAFPYTLGRVPAGTTAELIVPADLSGRPWRTQLTPAPADVCTPTRG